MKRILVTGSNGQLGKCIQKAAKYHTQFDFSFFNSSELDITNLSQVKAIFALKNFDFCINCAAYTNVEKAELESEKAFDVNEKGVHNIAHACLTNNVILIHISTDYVFDGNSSQAYLPESPTNPINVYGASKLAGEKVIQKIMSNFYIIRTSWLYSEYGKNFYTTILNKARAGELLQINDEQTGCPTNANSLTQFICDKALLEKLVFGIHHFTDGEAMTWYDFAAKIISENNLNSTTKVVIDNNYCSFARRPKYSVLKNRKYNSK